VTVDDSEVVALVEADVVADEDWDVVAEVEAELDCVDVCVVWSHALKLPAKCESIASFMACTVLSQSFNPAVK
jgi:hypothetical protein